MAADEKHESEWEEAERCGPYRLHEQVQPTEENPAVLYRAVHEQSGAAALVLKLAEEEGAPVEPLEARCVVSSSPGYLAVEVRQAPSAVAPDKHSMESLVCAVESTHGWLRQMLKHVEEPEPRPAPAPEPPPHTRPRSLARAGLVVAFALAFVLVVVRGHASPPPGSGDGGVPGGVQSLSGQGPLEEEPLSFEDPVFLGLARPLPSEPLKRQKRPPCDPGSQKELLGACWLVLEVRAPCPNNVYQHEGKCYVPVLIPEAPPPAGDH